ncbi:MAG: hypothetical protein AAFU80_08800 [Pseudomonadota bacterium]
MQLIWCEFLTKEALLAEVAKAREVAMGAEVAEAVLQVAAEAAGADHSHIMGLAVVEPTAQLELKGKREQRDEMAETVTLV